jgi:hypothetical protein
MASYGRGAAMPGRREGRSACDGASPRCRYRREVCTREDPPLYVVSHDRRSACHFYQEVLDHAR